MNAKANKRLGKWPGNFLSAHADHPERLFRAELALAFALFELVVTGLACLTESMWGTPELGKIYLVGLLPILGCLIWLSLGGRPERVGLTLMSVVFTLITITNLATGGRAIGPNIALPTVALFGVMMSSKRAGIVWLLLITLEIAAVVWLRRQPWDFPIRPDPQWVSSAMDRVPLFFSLGSALIGWMAIRAIEGYRERLAASQAAEASARATATESAQRFEEFAQIAADGFWETDADLRLTYVSPGFARLMAMEVDEMLGKTPGEAYSDKYPHVTGVDEYMAPLVMREEIEAQLLMAPGASGQIRWLVNQGRPRFSQGRFLGYRGSVRDITERKAAEGSLRASENRLRLVTESSPALIAYFDGQVRYQFCNSLACEVLGMPREQILGRTMREVRGEQVYAGLSGHVEEVLAGKPVVFEGEGDWNGRHYHFQTTYTPDLSEDGATQGFYAVTFDVSNLKQAQLALANATRKLRLITDAVPAAISHMDASGRFTFSNLTHAKWLGRAPEQVVGQLVADVHKDDIFDQIAPQLKKALAGERSTFELTFANHQYRATYVPEEDASGRVVGVYGLINDITQLKRVEQELRTLSQFDSLTGLANRRRYGEKIAEAIARSERSGQTMAVMFMDIDRFKSINDSLGHKAGDLVLQEFGRRLGNCVRRTDTVARLAGDEFVIILEPLTLAEEAAVVARKICAAMEPPFALEGRPRQVSTSIGIAIRKPGEDDGEALLRRADEALYAAKSAQRGSYRIAV